MRLKKRRRDWEKRMAQEQEEKAQLREQEASVVNEIIDSQVSKMLFLLIKKFGEYLTHFMYAVLRYSCLLAIISTDCLEV